MKSMTWVKVPLYRHQKEYRWVPEDHPDILWRSDSAFFRGAQVGWNGEYQYSSTIPPKHGPVPALTKTEKWSPRIKAGIFSDLTIPTVSVRNIIEKKRVVPSLGIAQRFQVLMLKCGRSLYHYSDGTYRVM